MLQWQFGGLDARGGANDLGVPILQEFNLKIVYAHDDELVKYDWREALRQWIGTLFLARFVRSLSHTKP